MWTQENQKVLISSLVYIYIYIYIYIAKINYQVLIYPRLNGDLLRSGSTRRMFKIFRACAVTQTVTIITYTQ
jgi:hypothetical protein